MGSQEKSGAYLVIKRHFLYGKHVKMKYSIPLLIIASFLTGVNRVNLSFFSNNIKNYLNILRFFENYLNKILFSIYKKYA